MFSPANAEEVAAYNELQAQRLIELKGAGRGGPRAFTEAGVDLILNYDLENSSKGETVNETKPDPKRVFVIHGRNAEARKQFGYFLNSLGLQADNFGDIRSRMGGSASIAAIINQGMSEAQGVIALFTADEFSALTPQFRTNHDDEEQKMRWQARPNVLFEAGMAFGRDPDRVAFVLLGHVKLFSDISGVHVLRPTNDKGGHRATLRDLLAGGMKCDVIQNNSGWMEAGDFETCVKVPEGVHPRDPFHTP